MEDRSGRPAPRLVEPIDAADPRFAGSEDGAGRPSARELIASRGPGAQPEDRLARILRIAVPVAFLCAVGAVAAVFFAGLAVDESTVVVGPAATVRAAAGERPRLVCVNDNNPCAWLTVVDGRLLALSSNGTLPDEYGRHGVGWCASSGYFGANATGSRYDAAGRVVRGPAPRGLDLVEVGIDDQGRVLLDFGRLTTNLQAERGADTVPATGPDCDRIPFDPEAFMEIA